MGSSCLGGSFAPHPAPLPTVPNASRAVVATAVLEARGSLRHSRSGGPSPCGECPLHLTLTQLSRSEHEVVQDVVSVSHPSKREPLELSEPLLNTSTMHRLVSWPSCSEREEGTRHYPTTQPLFYAAVKVFAVRTFPTHEDSSILPRYPVE